MRYLAIALIAVGIIAADLGASLWLDGDAVRGWNESTSIVLIWCAVVWWRAERSERSPVTYRPTVRPEKNAEEV